MARSSSKDIQQLIKQAECQGWRVELTKNHHYKWLSPLGDFFFSASTPSDGRAVNNIRRDLKKHGFLAIIQKKGNAR